jgi:multiple sugar transport system permease protein
MENIAQRSINLKSSKKIIGKVLIYIILIMLTVIVFIPFLWMLSTALKSEADVFSWPPDWIPKPVQWNNFVDAWRTMPFTKFLQNTLFVVLLGMVAELISETIVAYGFARFDFPGKNLIFVILLSTMMLPFHVTLIPTFVIWNKLGLIGEFDPLVLRAWTAWGPFYIFLLRQFFMGIPIELDEAAEIDGSSPLQTFLYVLLPQIKPALLAIGVFTFKGYWNDFLGPLIYLGNKEKYTMNIGMYFFLGGINEAPKWNYLMAMSTLIALPVVVLFFIAQKYFIEGIAFTGIKD